MKMYYTLKWPKHYTIMELFRSLPETKALMDITLLCEGRKINAHKLVLASCSLYFGDLLRQHPEANIIVVHDMSYEDLEVVINFMYIGDLIVCPERIASIMDIVKGFKLRGFTNEKDQSPVIPWLSVFVCSGTRPQIPIRYEFPSDYFVHRNPLEPSLPPTQDPYDSSQPNKSPPKKKLMDADDVVSTMSSCDACEESFICPAHKAMPHQILPSSATALQESMLKQSEIQFPDTSAAGSVSSTSLNSCSPIKTRNFPRGERTSSLQEASNDVTTQCIFCEGRCRSRLVQVGEKGRDLLKTEIHQKDEHIYWKIMNYEKLFIHTECKRKHASTPDQNKCQKKVPIYMKMDYTVKWPKHYTIMELFRSLPETRALMDITLLCEGRKIHAHKLVLASCSLYFGDLLRQHPEANIIVVHNMSYEDLKVVINFMYIGDLFISPERIAFIMDIVTGFKLRSFTNEMNLQCAVIPSYNVFVFSATRPQRPIRYEFPSDYFVHRNPLEPSLPPTQDPYESSQPNKIPPKKKLMDADDVVSTMSSSDACEESFICPAHKAMPHQILPSSATTLQESMLKQSEIQFPDTSAAGSVSSTSLNSRSPIKTRNFPTGESTSSLQEASNDERKGKRRKSCNIISSSEESEAVMYDDESEGVDSSFYLK